MYINVNASVELRTFVRSYTDDYPYDTNITGPQCELNEYKLEGGMKLIKRKKAKIIRYVRYYKDKDPENH